MKKRIFSMLIVLCMVLSMFPTSAFATEDNSPAGEVTAAENTASVPAVCPHTEHDGTCGYQKAVESAPCSHLNKGGNYDCPPTVSGNQISLNGTENVCAHIDGCGYAEQTAGAPCTHECRLCRSEASAFRSAGALQANDIGYTYDQDSKTLTVTSDAGTTAWKDKIYSGNITTVVISAGVTTIGERAFLGCSNLSSVTIPDSVTAIGNAAFSGCTSLISVTIPDSVTTIGEESFDDCTSLISVTIPGSVNTIGIRAFVRCTSLISVIIPTGVTTIGNQAFSECTSLISVIIPTGVTTIGEYAFSWCENLGSVTIPTGVTTIGKSAFYGCTSLNSVTIPDSVTTIGESAFSRCENLGSVTIPAGVTTIGKSTFYYCTNLSSVTIPDSVNIISEKAFLGCNNLSSVTIPAGVTTIGEYAFYECTSLSSVTIPAGVNTIGEEAFCECISLSSVTFEGKASPASFGTDVFKNVDPELKIFVPAGSEGDYKLKCNGYEDKIEAIKDAAAPVISTDLDTAEVTYTKDTAATALGIRAAVTDGGTLSYEWYRSTTAGTTNGTKLNITTDNYTPSTAEVGTAYYYCVVTNKNDSVTGTKTAASTSKAAMITVSAAFSSNNNNNNNNGGGDSSSDSQSVTSTPHVSGRTGIPTVAEVSVETVSAGRNGVTVRVTEAGITDAIARARAESRKNGRQADGIALVLNAVTGKRKVNTVTVNLPKTVQDLIISNRIVYAEVVTDNPGIRISLDLQAVTEIRRQAKTDVNITAVRLKGSSLKDEAKKVTGSRPVFELKVNYGNGGSVSSFGTGRVGVSVPYTLKKGEKASAVSAFYTDAAGSVQWVNGSVYDAAAGLLRFSTDHSGVYAVGCRPDTSAVTDTGKH